MNSVLYVLSITIVVSINFGLSTSLSFILPEEVTFTHESLQYCMFKSIRNFVFEFLSAIML